MTKICKVCGKEFSVTNKNQTKKVCSLACRTIARRMAKRTSDIKTAIEFLGREFHGKRIASHYAHAREKHPYFCDGILSPVEDYKGALANQRSRLAAAVSCRMVTACDLIDCELLEAYVEAANGNTVHTVEECYDAIAVLLRTIDVLEGRQKLGKPEAKGEAK